MWVGLLGADYYSASVAASRAPHGSGGGVLPKPPTTVNPFFTGGADHRGTGRTTFRAADKEILKTLQIRKIYWGVTHPERRFTTSIECPILIVIVSEENDWL